MQYDEYFIRKKIWFKNVSSEVFTVDSLFGWGLNAFKDIFCSVISFNSLSEEFLEARNVLDMFCSIE